MWIAHSAFQLSVSISKNYSPFQDNICSKSIMQVYSEILILDYITTKKEDGFDLTITFDSTVLKELPPKPK